MRRTRFAFILGVRLLFLALLGGLSSGCGRGPSPIPVSGHATLNGRPMTAGSVTFHPNKEKGNTFGGLSVGEINSQGEYKLQTNGKPGAPLGWYKVTVTATDAPPDNTKVSTTSAVNPTYSLPELTPLEVEVKDNAPPGAYDLKIGP